MSQTPSSSTTTTTTTTAQNTCSVTNNLTLPTNPNTVAQTGWDGGITVISGYNTSDTSSAQDYLQNCLTQLSFLQEGSSASSETSTSSTVLPLGETGLLNLLPYYEPGTTTVNNAYSLMVSQSNNYFPVGTYGVIKMGHGFSAITVPQASPCNASSAANAFQFLQNFMAFPSSPLAQAFTSALNADSTSTSTSQAENVNAFFAATPGYQNVTFPIYAAVSSYISAYAYVWANFQSSYSYKFYTTTPTSSDSSSSTGSTQVQVKEQITLVGTVDFKQTGNLPPDVSDANAGYTITWTPAGGSPVSLNYVNGQLVNPTGTGFSSICLQFTFMDMAALTGNSADSGIPIQALAGVVSGTNVLGSPVTLSETTGTDVNKVLSKVMSSNYMLALQILIALVMGVSGLVELVAWVKKKVANDPKHPPTKEEITDQQQEIQNKAEDRAKAAGNDQPVKTGDQLLQQQQAVESTNLNAQTQATEANELNVQTKEEEGELQLGNNPQIQKQINNTQEGIQEVKEVNPKAPDANQQLNTIQQNIQDNQNLIQVEQQQLGEGSNQQVIQQEKVENVDENQVENEQKKAAENKDGQFEDKDMIADE